MSTTAAENSVPTGSDQPAHRKFVGPPEKYDLASASQFGLLTTLGLRETHTLADIGCGSLRAGRLFIVYLLPEKYFGIEPEKWLIDQAIETEIGRSLADIKKPAFSYDRDFTLSSFGRKFDFLLAQSVFSHATQKQIHRCLSEAKKTLAPAGIFAATYFPGETNYEGTDWVYPGRVHFRPEFFAKMAADEGLAVTPINWTHTNEQSWVAITHPDQTAIVPKVEDVARIGVIEHELAMARQRYAAASSLHGFKLLKRINRIFWGKQ